MSIDTSAGRSLGALSPLHHAIHRLVEHSQIELEAHRLHESRLLRAEQIAGAAELEILERHAIAGAELGVMLEHLQPALGVDIHGVRDEQIAVRAAVASAPRGRGAGRAARDRNGRRDSRTLCSRSARRAPTRRSSSTRARPPRPLTNRRITSSRSRSRICPCATATRARGASRCTWSAIADDRLDAVVDEEHLAAAIELARDPLLDQPVVPRLDEGEHGRPIARRRRDHRHVAQAGERLVQRARNRRGGEREHVGLELELLETLLVLHAEAMLLVDDDEARGCRS